MLEMYGSLGVYTCMCVLLRTQSYLTLCNPKDCSPPGSSVHGQKLDETALFNIFKK